MKYLFWILVFLILWLAPIIWAFRKKHNQRSLIVLLVLLLGPLGYLIALIILSHKPPAPILAGDTGVLECEHCNAPYRLSDYLDGVDIFCSECKKQIARPSENVG